MIRTRGPSKKPANETQARGSALQHETKVILGIGIAI